MEEKVLKVKDIATKDSVNERMKTLYGHESHDGLIPKDNQRITENVSGRYIMDNMKDSNVELGVFHVLTKSSWESTSTLYTPQQAKEQYDNIEEAQNRVVRAQLNAWIKMVK